MITLANRPRVSEMDERQRRAVFARLHGGGGGSRRGPAVPRDGTSPDADLQSLETPTLSDSERESLWAKLREGATDTRTLPPRSELSDERLLQIDRNETQVLEQVGRAIEQYRSTSFADQFQTRFVHAAGDMAGGIASVVDPFEKLLGDPEVAGPLTRALQQFDAYTHTAVPDVAPKGAGPTIAALAGGAVPFVAGGELAGSLSWVQKAVANMGTAGEIFASWKTPLLAALTALGIGKYRTAHPTMSPTGEKTLAIAQQVAGYVAAITGIGAGKGTASALAPNQLEKLSKSLARLGEAASSAGGKIAGKLPDALRTSLKKAHAGYTAIADVTGASLSDVLSLSSIPGRLRAAAAMRYKADTVAREIADLPAQLQLKTWPLDAMRSQAAQIEAEAERMAQQAWQEAIADSAQASQIRGAAHSASAEMKDQAGRILMSSHKGSRADWQSASRMYAEGADKWRQSEIGLHTSGQTAQQMEEQALQKMLRALSGEKASRASAAQMRQFADEAQAELERLAAESADRLSASRDALLLTATQTENAALMTGLKAALVGAGFVAKEFQEEAKIGRYQQQMEEQFAQGEDFVMDPEQPRSVAGSLAAGLAGTLGNPIEKQFRYGEDAYDASVAYYRARYDAIGAAEDSGELTSAEADAMRTDLAKYKPKNMAGKGPWTFAPAAAAFASWQASNLADYFSREVEVGRVEQVFDGDTIQVAGRKIRMLGVDTPESIHPDKPVEYLGPEASAFQKENLTGKTVKLVRSPGVKLDKYDRQLAYVEALPGPFDKALAMPGIGKWLPAADQNLKTIEAGYGQPRYLELSGGHARQIEYDKATARAKAAGIGVHSPEGLKQLDYHYQTWDERHSRENGAGDSVYADLGTALGAGLMFTGQSGVLREMGGAGTAIAQAWNAALAGIGVADFNAKAGARTNGIVFRPPRELRTAYEKW